MRDNKIVTYLLYAIGEIVLVVVGILIAVSIDNANEDQKERAIEVKYLKSLREDLLSDSSKLVRYSAIRKENISSGLFVLNRPRPVSLKEYQTLIRHIDNIIIWVAFIPSNNTFTELTSSGNLSIIKNDDIKNGLMELDRINSQIVELRDHMRYEYNTFIYPIYFGEGNLFELYDFDKYITSKEWTREPNHLSEEELKTYITDIYGVLTSKRFKNAWKQTLVNHKVLIEYYADYMNELNQIQEIISKELGQL